MQRADGSPTQDGSNGTVSLLRLKQIAGSSAARLTDSLCGEGGDGGNVPRTHLEMAFQIISAKHFGVYSLKYAIESCASALPRFSRRLRNKRGKRTTQRNYGLTFGKSLHRQSVPLRLRMISLISKEILRLIERVVLETIRQWQPTFLQGLPHQSTRTAATCLQSYGRRSLEVPRLRVPA